MAAKDFSLKGYSAAEIRAAEKRMFKIIAEKSIVPEKPKALTIEDVYSKDELLRITYVPVVLGEIIWRYVGEVLDYCAANRIQQVKKLSRAVKELRESYYQHLRRTRDKDYLEMAARSTSDFNDRFGWQMQLTWFTINGELLKNYPNAAYLDMVCYAHCAALLVRVLKNYCAAVDKDVEKRVQARATILTPKIGNLDDVMDGYIGNCEINQTELIRRCEIILRRALDTIKYEE